MLTRLGNAWSVVCSGHGLARGRANAATNVERCSGGSSASKRVANCGLLRASAIRLSRRSSEPRVDMITPLVLECGPKGQVLHVTFGHTGAPRAAPCDASCDGSGERSTTCKECFIVEQEQGLPRARCRE